MHFSAADDIPHQPRAAVRMKDESTMDCATQTCISVVAPSEEIEPLTCDPFLCRNARYGVPCERSIRKRLVLLVHANSVVGSRGTKIIAATAVRDVTVRSRINQPALVSGRKVDAQRVSMTVAASTRALWSGINRHECRLNRIGENVNAALGKPDGMQSSLRAAAPVMLNALFAKDPKSFLSQVCRLREILTFVKNGSDGKRIGQMINPVSARIEHSAAIIIAERDWKPRLRDGCDHVEHSTNHLVELLRHGAAFFSANTRQCRKKSSA